MHQLERKKLKNIVARQLPEHIREDYPTFVAFVEAYYDFLQQSGVDFSNVRDIDRTLDEYITYFKKELAYNLPNIVEDERLLLQHIKDQYLAKGSEGSYKLLFKLLFGKNVQLTYPGDRMLRCSDGQWNQEISVFARVDYGDPEQIVGKLVDIQSGARILRVLMDRKQDLVGEVDRIVAIGGDIYEFYLDKKFFGEIKKDDRIKYEDQFQATILPATTFLEVIQPGVGFRVGQVFEIKSGVGTGALFKVTQTTSNGGIIHGEFIKFGIGYAADFAVSILATNTVTKEQKIDTGSSQRIGNDLSITDSTGGLFEQGYIQAVNYVTEQYVDGAYAGTIVREFSLNAYNAQTNAEDPAIIQVNLGALNKYPGYYETNRGFLSDNIYIQDSRYYQIFSYVLRIDERLSAYKSAVKTMIHPAGMALFGEFDITNTLDLGIALEAIVKSLGIGVEDEITVDAQRLPEDLSQALFGKSDMLAHYLTVTKQLSSTQQQLDDTIFIKDTAKTFETLLPDQSETTTIDFTKVLNPANGYTDSVSMTDPITNWYMSKSLNTTLPAQSSVIDHFDIDKSLTTTLSTPVDLLVYGVDKYLETNTIGNFTESGYLVFNPYEEGGYFAEIYVNGRDSTF